MRQFKVRGRFVITFEGIVNAYDAIQAEKVCAELYREELDKTVIVEGRPFAVSVEPVKEAENEEDN
jgi:hypothetical protein